MNLLRRVALVQPPPLLRLQYHHGLGARSRLPLPAGRAFQNSATPLGKPLAPSIADRTTPKDTFESIGIYTPLAANLKNRMAIEKPTQLQKTFIPAALEGKDVLIRDTTGSGKTFGLLLSLLNKSRRQILSAQTSADKGRPSKNNSNSQIPSSETGAVGITSVVIVPNQELALQLLSWTRGLFPSFSEQDIDRTLQVVVTPSLSLPDEDYSLLEKRSIAKATINEATLEGNRQIEKLARDLPHVLVATPTRLWELIERGILDLSGIETIVLDEVDHLIRLPKRYASHRQIYNRALHPKPAELAVREIIRSAKAAGRYSAQEEGGELQDRIQVIAASATMNRPIRYWLEENEWVKSPEWVDTTKSVVLPEGIHHHCVVISSDSIRNMHLEAERYSERQHASTSKANDDGRKAGRSSDIQNSEEPVDWSAVDQEWKDKNAEWKEKQLSESRANPSSDSALEKFKDDDDRMLEGVAMACMLDKVQNACVFFCSSTSLNQVAARLDQEFGLRTKLISNAFGSSRSMTTAMVTKVTAQEDEGHGDAKAALTPQPKTLTPPTPSRKGIFLAHESNARGLDLPKLSHVYIVGLPSSPSSYLHMAGRTGRMGERGQVVTILRDAGHIEDRARSLFKRLGVEIQPFTHVQ